MTRRVLVHAALLAVLPAAALARDPSQPTWWAKYQLLSHAAPDAAPRGTSSARVAADVDVSNECAAQSETYVTLNPSRPKVLAAGSNEIYRLPMRGYFSSDGGTTWSGVDLPLPPTQGANDVVFGSDPTLAFDTSGNAFYGYILVFFSAGGGLKQTGMAVARSTDGGRSWPGVAYFSLEGGENHFNDKPMITADTSPTSPFRDAVYVAWDAALGGSTSGGVRLARSTDHGATFATTRVDDPRGQGLAIGAVPFTDGDGAVYVAWNDYAANTIALNRSFDGGVTWDAPRVVAAKSIAFDIDIPAEQYRGALVYPSCAADRSSGPHRGRLYCAWMDGVAAAAGTLTDIVLSWSDDQGATWSSPAPVTDRVGDVDRFDHWLSVDPVTGDVLVSFYDTRNDTTGERYMTDTYLARSTDGAATWAPNVRVSSVSSNEHDCGGVFPCSGIDYGNQQGDYEGLAAYGGVAHPIWTDSRRNLAPMAGCRVGLAMEEVFTASVYLR